MRGSQIVQVMGTSSQQLPCRRQDYLEEDPLRSGALPRLHQYIDSGFRELHPTLKL